MMLIDAYLGSDDGDEGAFIDDSGGGGGDGEEEHRGGRRRRGGPGSTRVLVIVRPIETT